ncbi:hypothetical protein CHELA40_12916 [Chelatococcus asaccharovorans]|nr:hypothetical protein CHELA40_12916 [Chelatococcus asaccharovorans]CAH1681231.1 hypothetical protein CHELA17_62702 [Chelatococcus asaccharovorans]
MASEAPNAASIAARSMAASMRWPRSRWGSSRPAAAKTQAAVSVSGASGRNAVADAGADSEIIDMVGTSGEQDAGEPAWRSLSTERARPLPALLSLSRRRGLRDRARPACYDVPRRLRRRKGGIHATFNRLRRGGGWFSYLIGALSRYISW